MPVVSADRRPCRGAVRRRRGGRFDSPARGQLYPDLCAELPDAGIAALRVRYRIATELEEAALDVLAGIQFLAEQGIAAVALVGHSFGGAVVIQAAAAAAMVRGAAALATQSYGAQPAARLGPRCALLLAHGTDDEVLAPSCSRYVYQIAAEPKRLVLFPGARHGLDEAAEAVHRLVCEGSSTGCARPTSDTRRAGRRHLSCKIPRNGIFLDVDL